LREVKMIDPETIEQSVLRIQRFWRRVSKKNMLRVYKCLFSNAICKKEKMGKETAESNSSVILVCSEETSEELEESHSHIPIGQGILG
jgi:hypothetical protein